MSKNIYTWFACCLLALLTALPLSVNAAKALPYSYGFEDNDLTTDGWTKSSAVSTNDSEFGIVAAAKHNGDYGFRFSSYSTATAYDQYLISPELDAAGGVVVTFYYAASNSSGTEKFKVGYSTTDTEISSFTFGSEISTNSTTWTESDEYAFPAGTKYVAIHYSSNYQYRLYVDDLTFAAPASCQKPANLTISDITATSAKATWAAGGTESEWDISIDGGASRTSLSTTSRTFTGLTPNTEYTVSLRAKCGDNEYSAEVTATFRTACATLSTFPYSENFDGITGSTNSHVLPSCWDWMNTCTYSTYSYYPMVYNGSSYSKSGNNSLKFYSSYSSWGSYEPQDQYAILPPMSGISGLRMKLWARAYSISYDATFIVGVMSDPADTSTFVVVASKTPAAASYEEFVIPFNKYSGNGEYIAIKMEAADASHSSRYVYIDDITVEELPSCLEPSGLSAKLTPGNGTIATLSWVAGANESAWLVEYSSDETFAQALSANATDTVITLTGLTPDVTYYARVKAVCSATDASTWSNVVSFTPTSDLVINDGTATNSYVPVYGTYVDDYTNSKFIIPAEKLSDLLWGSITKLTFFANTASTDWGDARFEVYMATTTATTLSALGDWNSMDKVMNAGSLSIANNKMEVTLDAPYRYEGGNLLIGFKQTVEGTYVGSTWLGVAAPSGSSVYCYSSSTPGSCSATQQSFLPKMQIAFNPGEAPACLKPTKLAISAIAAQSATFSWNPISGASYEYVVLPDTVAFDAEQLSADAIHAATDTFAVISGLNANSGYHAYVRATCGSDGSSDWSAGISFRTKCNAIAEIPFVESFENSESSSLPSVCWTRVQSYNSYPSVGSYSSSAYQGSKYLYFNGGASTSEQIIALPEISADLSNARIRFWYKNSGVSESSPSLILGKMSDVDDANSFVAIATLDKKSLYTAYEKELTGVGSDYHYLAFKYAGGTSTSYAYVDSIIIDAIPSCYPVVSLGISEEDGAITANSVLIEWAGHQGQNSSYLVTVKNGEEFISYNGEAYDNKLVNGNSLRVRGLESSKSYDLTVSIVAACAENDHSEVFTDHIVFNTLCEKISALPWRENFDGMTGVTSSHKLPTCWDYINTCTNSSYNYYPTVYNSTSSANSGSNSLRFYSYYSSYTYYSNPDPQDQYAILPELDGLNGLRIKFNARAYSSSYDASIMVGVMSDPSDASTFELVTTLSPASTDYEEFIIPMNTYTGSGKYIAIKMLAADATNAYRGFYIDDIVVEDIPSCLEPTGLTAIAESMRAHSALLTWVPQANESTWLMQYKKSSDSVWTAVSEPILNDTFRLEGLDAFTLYDVQVAAWCNPDNVDAKSPYCSTYSFMTSASVPFDEEFGASAPSGWAMYSGLLSDVQAGAELTNASSGWSFGAGNGVFDNHARSNIYGTSSMKWLVTPAIEIEDNVQLSFNLALTAYSGTLDAPATDGTDDKFVVLITEDGGATWSILRQWDNAGSANVYNNIACTANGQLELINLSSYSGKTVNIAFYGESTESNADNNIHIDNVSIDYIPACPKATGLGVVDVTAEGATFFWDNISDGAWKYAVALASESEPAASAYIAITDTFVVINGKESDSEYIFYLRHDCGNEGLSPATSKAFHTLQLPADPSNFSDDFEAGNSWLFINGSLTNAWVWGEAAHNGEGTHALYISNDGGTSHAYTNNSAVVVYATKSFTFAEGSYTFEYDWLANGESNYDYLRVALVPASVALSAATSLPAGLSTTSVPEGWIALDGGSKLNLTTAWQKFTSEEIPVAAGTYNVVLMWRDDTSTGAQTPAAVDNFSISRVLCSKLSQVVVADSTITSSSAVISWAVIDGQNAWQIALDTVSAFNPSEASLIAATSNPYTLNGLAADKRYYAYVRANCGADGFSAWSDKVSFKTAKACQTPDGIAAEVTVSSAVISWNTYGQTAFSLRYGQGSNWLDTISVNSGSYVLTDLDANTSYNVQVQTACDTIWSATYAFKTLCSPISEFPWSEGFESYTGAAYNDNGVIPDCWDAYSTGTVIPHVIGGTSSTSYVYVHDGSKALTFYGSGYNYAVLPEFSVDMNSLVVSFWYQTESATYGKLTLGYITADDEDCNTFVAIEELPNHNGSMVEYEKSLTNLPATAARLVLQWYCSNQWSCCVDDVTIERKLCGDLSNLRQEEATTNSATFAWDAVESALGYEYVVLAEGEALDEANAVQVSAAEATVTGLHHSSFYTIYVRAICSEGAGRWTSIVFHTECTVISSQEGYDNEENALIFDFEEYAAGKNLKDEILCWDVISGVWTTTSTHHAGSVGAYVAGLGAADTAAVLVTPAFEIIDGQELVAFVKEGSSHNDGDSVLFYINDAPSLEGATLIGKIEAADDWREFRKKLPEGWFTEEEVDEYDEAYILIQAYAYSAIYFDDIMLHEAPSCSKIMNIALEAETNALNVTWQAGGDETMWAVSYSVKNAGNAWEGLVSDTPAIVINNLPANTADSLFITIQSLCDGGATPGEVVEAAFAFKTLCGVISEFPWTENFDALTAGIPDCWDNSEGTTTSASYKWNYFATGHNGACVRFNSYNNSSNKTNILATPMIQLPANPVQLGFYCMNPKGGNYSVSISVAGGEPQVVLNNLTNISAWTEKEVDLTAYAGQTIQIFFNATSNYGSGDAYLYLDDVTITPITSCKPAKDAGVKNITMNSATLYWSPAATAGDYRVTVKDGEEILVDNQLVQDTFLVISNLTPSTAYTLEASITTDCGNGEVSYPYVSEIAFTTKCEAIDVTKQQPWAEDFEDYAGASYSSNGVIPDCWDAYSTSSVRPHVIPSSDTYGYVHSGTKALTFYGSGTNYAILPAFEAELNTLQISFWYATESSSNGTLTLGYITAEDVNCSTFTAIQQYPASSASYRTMVSAEVSLNELPASASRLVFRWYYSSQYSCTIDDVEVIPQPTCQKPSDVALVEYTTNSASFTWEGNADNYSVKIYNGTNLIADTLIAASELPFEIDTLQANTSYPFRFVVKGICSEDDESAENSSVVTVHTMCEALVIDDENWWAEDFNSLTQQYSIPDCWSNEEGTTTYSSYKWGAVGTGAVGSAYLRFNSYNNADGNTNVLATPLLTLPETPAQLVFLCKNPAGGDFNVAIAGEDGVRDIVLSNLTGIADWTEQKIMLGDYAGQTIRIFFNATSNCGTSAGNCFIDLDSVVINAAPNCMPVKNIEKFSVSENEVVFIWESNSDETQWDVLVTDNLHENAELFNASVDVRAISIALEANTKYSMHVSVVAHCSDEDMAEAVSADFIFRSPLSEDMVRVVENNTVDTIDLSDPDEQAKWTLLGADETNHFIFASFNENAGLYISNDDASWQYTTIDAPSAAIAYRAFSVPEDNTPVEISFKWQANGQSTIDYGRAFIAGAEAEFEIANHQAKINGVQMAANNAILGAYNLSTGASVVLSGVSTEQSLAEDDYVLDAGQYYIVFAWRNNDDEGAQNPLGIYDLKIWNKKGYIPSAVDNITGEGVEVQKILHNGQVYILRDGVIYSILGTIVR